MWDFVAKTADVAGILLGSSSLIITIVTLVNTKKIRSAVLSRVEKSEYQKAIDEQVADLDAFSELLTSGETLEGPVFLKIMKLLKSIRISYETVLPDKVKKKIDELYDHIEENFYKRSAPYNKTNVSKCMKLLVYVCTELKKEKEAL